MKRIYSTLLVVTCLQTLESTKAHDSIVSLVLLTWAFALSTYTLTHYAECIFPSL